MKVRSRSIGLVFVLIVLIQATATPLDGRPLSQGGSASAPQQKPASTPADSSAQDTTDTEAIIETDLGTITIDLFPDLAPRHVAYFARLAREGFYNGTTFFRLLRNGLIQAGDPLTKNPKTPRAQWGTGGLDKLKPEFHDMPFLRGTVGAVLRPGQPESGGSQFFICVTDQTQLTKQYTAFGRVTKGIDVVEQISEQPVDSNSIARDRIQIKTLTVRKPQVFSADDAKNLRVVIETELGEMSLALLPDVAPRHVRHFMNLVGGGFYDGTTFHRIYADYMIMGGDPLTRSDDRSLWGRGWIGRKIGAEFNKTQFERGTVGMWHGQDPDGAITQFFICLKRSPQLDEKYTAFARVVGGLDVLDKIAALPADENKAPQKRIVLRRFRLGAT